MNILLLIGGLILILLGANGLTDGAASVAKRFHIPPIVIGLTIVAFGRMDYRWYANGETPVSPALYFIEYYP